MSFSTISLRGVTTAVNVTDVVRTYLPLLVGRVTGDAYSTATKHVRFDCVCVCFFFFYAFLVRIMPYPALVAHKELPFLERLSNTEDVMKAMLVKMELMDVHQVGLVRLS